jgi:hypothetical protein
MAPRTFSCSNCDEPFSLHLPAETTRADYRKCVERDKTYHNMERIILCQNCERRNTVYYCTESHGMLITED